LDNGTLIPYLEDAHNAGYATIVLNPNFRTETLPNPESHALYVWDNFIQKSPAKEILIVAHSYGGCVTMALLAEREDQVLARVKGIAFTDSVHSLSPRISKKARALLAKKSRDWVTSKRPLDAKIEELSNNGCATVSAGHTVHEYTSGIARPSVFEFLQKTVTPKK